MAKLYAIADLHVGHRTNAEALEALRPGPPGSGLILAGDLGETKAHLSTSFRKAKACFEHVFWVPGNHELYSLSSSSSTTSEPMDKLRGEAKYLACVALAQSHGVRTPEDEWMLWPPEQQASGGGADTSTAQAHSSPSNPNSTISPPHPDAATSPPRAIVAPIFTLYDYSFRPSHVSRAEALSWAMEENIQATDEFVLHADPHATRDEWCQVLCSKWEQKFAAYGARYPGVPFVIVNHWPLREDLVYIPRVPRFSLWCGTKRTADWHRAGRFGEGYAGAKVVVTGHLHVRRTDWIDGTRFEECSLGYPRQWEKAREAGRDVNDMLREILPGLPEGCEGGEGEVPTQWRNLG